MTCYKFKCSHWLKLQHSDWRANLVKDFFNQRKVPPMRALEFITDHVIYNSAYTYKFQLKTTYSRKKTFTARGTGNPQIIHKKCEMCFVFHLQSFLFSWFKENCSQFIFFLDFSQSLQHCNITTFNYFLCSTWNQNWPLHSWVNFQQTSFLVGLFTGSGC